MSYHLGYTSKSTVCLLVCFTACLSASCNFNDRDNVEKSSPEYEVRYSTIDKSASQFWSSERLQDATNTPLPMPNFPDELSLSSSLVDHKIVEKPPVNVSTKKFPYMTAGKIVFRKSGGVASCSAQLVGPKSNIVVTAAHCLVSKDGKWYKNFAFYRADGGAGRELLEADCVARFMDYYKPTGWKVVAADIGMVRLKKPYSRRLGLRAPASGDTEAIGYPSNFSGGNNLMSVTGDVTVISSRYRTSMMEGNPFNEGASGGAWIQEGRLVGINASAEKSKKRVFSPLVTGNVIRLYNHTVVTKCKGGNHGIRSDSRP